MRLPGHDGAAPRSRWRGYKAPIARPLAPRGLVHELQRSERLTVWILLAMLLISVVSAGYLLVASEPRVAHLTDLTRQSRITLSLALEQRADLYEWLASGDDSVRARFQETDAALGDMHDDLLRSADSPDISADIVATVLAHGEWQAWAQDTFWSMSDRELAAGDLTAVLAEGDRLFATYRATQALSTDFLAAERDDALTSQQHVITALLAATVAMLGGAAIVAVRRGRRLRDTVEAPLVHLLDTIGALRTGNLSVRLEPSGVDELDSIGAALGELASSLQKAGADASSREERLSLLATRFETVVRVTRETSASLSERYVAETVTSAAAELLGANTTLWTRGDEGRFLAVRRSADQHGVVPPSKLEAPPLVATAAADARAVTDGGRRAYPMILAGMVVGVLEVTTADPDEDAEHVLHALLSTAAAALEAARMHSSVRALADIDALTQLGNRRRLETDLTVEWKRCRRYSRPLSFLMLDLDNFKVLNDTYGHLAGDAMLKAVAGKVTGLLRSSDTAYRYGGEEIAVLLRETGVDDAATVGERLRTAIAAVSVTETEARLTTSVGVASATDTMAHHSELVARSDAALYLAKRDGRDRVVVASQSGAAGVSR